LVQDFVTHIHELRPTPGTPIEAALGSQLLSDMVELRGRELCCFLNSQACDNLMRLQVRCRPFLSNICLRVAQVLFANVVTLVEQWRPHMEVCRCTTFCRLVFLSAFQMYLQNCKAEVIHHVRNVSSAIATASMGLFPDLAVAINDIAQQIVRWFCCIHIYEGFSTMTSAAD
jgi:hypothetical protein